MRIVVALLVLALAGCAVPTFESLEQSLQRALPVSGGDCAEAEQLRETICDLARDVCAKADAAKSEAEKQARCVDGRERCERARVLVDQRCARGMVDERR